MIKFILKKTLKSVSQTDPDVFKYYRECICFYKNWKVNSLAQL